MSGIFCSFENFLYCSTHYRNKDSIIIEGLAIVSDRGFKLIGVECFGVEFLISKKEFTDEQIDLLYSLREQTGYPAPMC